jgi:hypothetical protein
VHGKHRTTNNIVNYCLFAVIFFQFGAISMTEIPIVIYGVVKDSNGNPVSQARVSFVGGPVSFPDIAALTDNKGTFALSAPVAGEYSIQVVADEFITKTVKITIENNIQKENIDIILSRK